jgi:phosphate transport system protein
MSTRERFDRQLEEVRQDVITMGNMVKEQLQLALDALEKLDNGLAETVFVSDKKINKARFALDSKCVAIIGTQQPVAHDLRALVSVMNIIVDLERMGDHAKEIGDAVFHKRPAHEWAAPPELKEMSGLVMVMLTEVLTAYSNQDINMAQQIIGQDDKVDELFSLIFQRAMERMAKTKHLEKVEARYETLRVAQSLERIADLCTNVAERVIYIMTGELEEVKIHQPHQPV